MKLYNIDAEIKELKTELKLAKRKEHKKFYRAYKNFFTFLDVIVVFIVLMNLGAISITNILLTEKTVEEGKPIVHYEAAPMAAKIGGFPTVEDVGFNAEEIQKQKEKQAQIIGLGLIYIIYWTGLITFYIYKRLHIHTHQQLLWLTIIVVMVFGVLSADFFNNFGLYLGKLIFGG